MGTASKVLLVLFRLADLICAAIVLGFLSRFLYLVHLGNGPVASKIVYAEVWAALSIAFAIILIVPLDYSFYAFPLDLIMFIGWMTAYGLLYNLTGIHTCSAYWYYHYWGYYWGRFWYIPVGNITSATVTVGCGEWRTVLAFSFIGGFCWLANTCLGIFEVARKHSEREPSPSVENPRKDHWWSREKHDIGTQQGATQQGATQQGATSV